MADEDITLVADDDIAQENKYLLFKLGNEEYGVDISSVQSIEEMQKIVSVPDMDAFVRGVINLRGKVIPVIDLRIKFHMPEREYDDRTCMIITSMEEKAVGFIVDTVSEVKEIPESRIDPAPDFRADKQVKRYIAGLGRIEDEVKILVDVESIITIGEIEAISEKV